MKLSNEVMTGHEHCPVDDHGVFRIVERAEHAIAVQVQLGPIALCQRDGPAGLVSSRDACIVVQLRVEAS